MDCDNLRDVYVIKSGLGALMLMFYLFGEYRKVLNVSDTKTSVLLKLLELCCK